MYRVLFFGIVSLQLTFDTVGLATCTEADCPEDYFCHEERCKKCLKCDVLFRKGNFCVIDFKDCKECLEGFEEISVTDFASVIKPCKPVKKKVKLKICENDSSCPQNNYCNEDSCVKCFDCGLLNRLPVEKCAKGLNECGSCMIGFNEVSVTTEENYKPCEKVNDILSELHDPYKMSLATIPFLCAVSVLLFFSAFILGYKKFKDQISNKTIYQPPIYPSAPPFNSLDTPPYIKRAEGLEPTFSGCIEEKIQQAKVFKQPDALYYYTEKKAKRADNPSPENNHRSRPSSFAPYNSVQSEESNCSAISLNRESEIALNEFGIDPLAEQSNDNIIEDIESPRISSVAVADGNVSLISQAFSLADEPSLSENSLDEEIVNITRSQN